MSQSNLESKYRLEELCLEITNKCLLDCVHCSSGSSIDGSELDENIIKEVIDDFEDLDGKELEISGGEPLLHSNVWKILNYCKNRMFSTTLYSTGISNIPPHIAAKKINVNRVAVSLFGTKEVTKRITGKDCYEISKSFIKNLIKRRIPTTVHFVPMKQNYRNFNELVEECEEMGVDEIKILRLMPQGRAKSNWREIHIPEVKFRRFIEYVQEMDSNVRITIGKPASYAQREKCKACMSTCLINSDGNVYPCPALKTKGVLSAGNIYEESLKDIWSQGFYSIRMFKELSGYHYCLAPRVMTHSDLREAIKEII